MTPDGSPAARGPEAPQVVSDVADDLRDHNAPSGIHSHQALPVRPSPCAAYVRSIGGEDGAVAAQQVHRSTHGEAHERLPTPLTAPLRPEVEGRRVGPVDGVSGRTSHRSAILAAQPDAAEYLLRNEGAVGSNPITSTADHRNTRQCAVFSSSFSACD
jgi:hypothetical protein